MAEITRDIKRETEGSQLQIYVPNSGIVEPPPGFSFVPPSPGFRTLSQSERRLPLHNFSFEENNFVKQEEIYEDLRPLIPMHELGDATRRSIKEENSSHALRVEPAPPEIDFIDDPSQNVVKKAGFFILTKDYFSKVMKTQKWKSLQCPPSSSTENVLELDLTERTQGWLEERRPRPSDGRVDKFYYHQKSNKTFRTFLSMLRFAKYSVVPKQLRKGIKAKSKDVPEMSLEAASYGHTGSVDANPLD